MVFNCFQILLKTNLKSSDKNLSHHRLLSTTVLPTRKKQPTIESNLLTSSTRSIHARLDN